MTLPIRPIIDALGGPSRLGRRLKIRSQAISLWMLHDQIPANRVPALEALALELGVPYRAENMRPDVDWSVFRRDQADAQRYQYLKSTGRLGLALVGFKWALSTTDGIDGIDAAIDRALKDEL